MINYKRFPRYVNTFQVKDTLPSQLFLQSPRKSILELNKNDIKILNYLIFMGNRIEDLYMRQSTIAHVFSLARATVNRIISKLCSLGLIGKIYRANKSCLYRVSSWFSEFDTQNRLKDILYSLTFLSVNLLRPNLEPEKMLHDIIKGKFNSKSSDIIILSNYDNNKGKVVNPYIEKLRTCLHLEFYEAQGLTKYSDQILMKAVSQLEYIKNVKDKSGYLFSLCEQELLPQPPIDPVIQQNSYTSDNSHHKKEVFPALKPQANKPYIRKEAHVEEIIDERVLNKFKKEINSMSGAGDFLKLLLPGFEMAQKRQQGDY